MPLPLEHPPISDEVTLSRYPFLPQSGPWIQSLAQKEGIDLDTLIDGDFMEETRRRGRLRLVESISNQGGVDAVAMRDIHTPEGKVLESFSFTYSRLVACACENEVILSRWAQAEAERSEVLLAVDEGAIEDIAKTYLSKVNFTVSSRGKKVWQIGLSDFIELVPGITGARWRLPNQDINDGWISLRDEDSYSSQAKLARILRERVKSEIFEDAKKKTANLNEDLVLRLAEATTIITGLMNQRSSEVMELTGAIVEDWPPCMKKAVAELEQGVNVNHFGRLFLASMARVIGLPVEACVGFFHNAPDFSQETTSYQVSHVYDREYTPAGCGKLKLNARCAVLPGENSLCDQPWLDHPLKYLKSQQRRRSRETQVVEDSSVTRDDS